MDNKTNKIMKLDSGKEYFINRQILYKGTTYYLCTLQKMDEEGNRVPDDEIVLYEEYKEDGKTMVRVVEDQEIAKTIYSNI
ncbi:MAG: hypothetical protein IJB82_03540 [Bacilli bacterium]|nr:hypothetical protein [Bacilli bacterium]